MKVVVVDRSDSVRARLVAHLREAGFAMVVDAASLAAARSIVTAFGPDVIVADVVYSDCRPIDVVGALRTLAPAAHVMILSNEVHVRARCIEDGAHSFFDKSTQLDQLVPALRRLAQ